jgi:hypothetical protein
VALRIPARAPHSDANGPAASEAKSLKQFSFVPSYIHTMTITKIDQMKTNTDTNLSDHSTLVSESAPVTSGRPADSARLKLLVLMASVTAAWLSYQTVTEAMVVSRILDQVQDAVSQPTLVTTPAVTNPQKSETNPRVAGL